MSYEKLMAFEEFKRLKITQYQSIKRVMDMSCPQCGRSSGFDTDLAEPKPVGWCDTPQGFMLVAECPLCFRKFRYHISITGRNNVEEFYHDYALRNHLYNKHQNHNGKENN